MSQDQSHLDRKYFIDRTVYNCPFCNRNHVSYWVVLQRQFNWSASKDCWVSIVKCESCSKRSLHLSWRPLADSKDATGGYFRFDENVGDIDGEIFFSQPTSFFALDERIPRVLRELITEAEAYVKMNLLTGASACVQKAVYEMLVHEKAEGQHYEDQIKFLKTRYRDVDPELFDTIGHIQDVTCDKVHEGSWPKWDSRTIKLLSETLKVIFYDIYVHPAAKRERYASVAKLREAVREPKTGKAG